MGINLRTKVQSTVRTEILSVSFLALSSPRSVYLLLCRAARVALGKRDIGGNTARMHARSVTAVGESDSRR